jgi:hypothetical protein
MRRRRADLEAPRLEACDAPHPRREAPTHIDSFNSTNAWVAKGSGTCSASEGLGARIIIHAHGHGHMGHFNAS